MRRWNTFAAHVLLMLAAGGLAVLTLGLPVVVSADQASLASVCLGWPVWFVVQDQSQYTPPGERWRTHFLSPWECPFQVVWWRFLVSWAAVAGLLEMAWRAAVWCAGGGRGVAVCERGEAGAVAGRRKGMSRWYLALGRVADCGSFAGWDGAAGRQLVDGFGVYRRRGEGGGGSGGKVYAADGFVIEVYGKTYERAGRVWDPDGGRWVRGYKVVILLNLEEGRERIVGVAMGPVGTDERVLLCEILDALSERVCSVREMCPSGGFMLP
ncbi:MAG: hypothetical protein QME70_07970 [Bacillota bacterium]|nr:hypothetical protein [Bacillota bacterium]